MPERRSIPCRCQQCSEPFLAFPAEVKRSGGKFCSRECYQTSLHQKSEGNGLRYCIHCQRYLFPFKFTVRNKRTGCRFNICKRCVQRDNRRREVKLHEMVLEYLLQHPCVDCGEADPLVLDFDHRDPDQKLAPISTLIHLRVPKKRLWTEILKCDVRCANCHRRKTASDLGWFKALRKENAQ